SRFVSGSECRLHCAIRSLRHLEWPSTDCGRRLSSVPRPLSPENPAKYLLREKRPMETNIKPKSASTNATQQVRGMTEKGAEQSREVLETIGAATNEAAEVMKNSCSTALKGLQDYNRKVIEFTQANTKSYVEFVQ